MSDEPKIGLLNNTMPQFMQKLYDILRAPGPEQDRGAARQAEPEKE